MLYICFLWNSEILFEFFYISSNLSYVAVINPIFDGEFPPQFLIIIYIQMYISRIQ